MIAEHHIVCLYRTSLCRQAAIAPCTLCQYRTSRSTIRCASTGHCIGPYAIYQYPTSRSTIHCISTGHRIACA
eukprot:3314299-Rhodomonas_salina.3